MRRAGLALGIVLLAWLPGMVQVLDGEIVVVAPDDAATAQLRYPRTSGSGSGGQ